MPKTPTELQTEAILLLRALNAEDLDVWEMDADSGEYCVQTGCSRVGFIFLDDRPLCATHAIAAVHNGGAFDLDVARPVLIPDDLAASEDLLELVRNFMYHVADRKGSTITDQLARKATALGNRCSKALTARRGAGKE